MYLVLFDKESDIVFNKKVLIKVKSMNTPT